MATIISAPIENSIINDANTTEIIIEDNASDYISYQAIIYINGFKFDGLIMPKMSNVSFIFPQKKMILTFDNLLNKYLSLPEVTNQFIQPFNVINDLKIELVRIDLQGYPRASFEFNYKLKYSQFPTTEKYEDFQLSWIAVDADTLLVPPLTNIQLPFYLRDESLLLTVTAELEDGTSLNQLVTTVSQTSNTLLANLGVNAPDDVDAYYFKIKAYNFEISKKIRVQRTNLYQPKRVRFYNRFGMPVLVELFGKISTKNDHTFLNYQNGQNQYKRAETQTDILFTVDTGNLLNSELPIVHQIAESLDVRIEINNVFVPCIPTLKSVPVFSENDFIKSIQLTFETNKYPKLKN